MKRSRRTSRVRRSSTKPTLPFTKRLPGFREPLSFPIHFSHDIVSGKVFPRILSCVKTLRSPSFPLGAQPLGFPRYRAQGAAYAAPENRDQKTKIRTSLRDDGRSSREKDKARNGGRRARSAAKPQSARWSPKRFAPPLASLRFLYFPRTLLDFRRFASQMSQGLRIELK